MPLSLCGLPAFLGSCSHAAALGAQGGSQPLLNLEPVVVEKLYWAEALRIPTERFRVPPLLSLFPSAAAAASAAGAD